MARSARPLGGRATHLMFRALPTPANLFQGMCIMKKFLLGAAAVVAVAAPGVAAAEANGYVDLAYTSSEADIGGLSGDADGWTVGGATSWGGDGSFGMQLDAVVSQSDADGGGDVSNWTLGGHAFIRDESHLFGAFASFGNIDIDGAGDLDHWTAGLEGQWYLARTTFDGAISYSEADDVDLNATALELGVTHFFMDNFSVNGGVDFGTLEAGGVDADVVSYGVGAEYQFAAMPVSIFGGWEHAEIDDADAENDALTVGVRWNWGGSLLERNRSGASLDRGGVLDRIGGLL